MQIIRDRVNTHVFGKLCPRPVIPDATLGDEGSVVKAQPGRIINAGELQVGQNLALLGGTVANTGQLITLQSKNGWIPHPSQGGEEDRQPFVHC